MKLAQIWINSFGPLSNVILPPSAGFGEGMNVIYGPNEAGKSQIKSFLEESLFPRRSGRTRNGMRPSGRIEFDHGGESYTLELTLRGNSLQRELHSAGSLIAGGIAELFPSMRTEGHEIYSNLYSFGLDQLLLSATAGSAALSEHLFGAVASGKGISISSISEILQDRNRRYFSRGAKVRSLAAISDDVEHCSREIRDLLAEESEFSAQLARLSQLTEIEGILESELEEAAVEVHLHELVESRRDQFQQYWEACAYLDTLEAYENLVGPTRRRLVELSSELERYRSESTRLTEDRIQRTESAESERSGLTLVALDREIRALKTDTDELRQIETEVLEVRTHTEQTRSSLESRAVATGFSLEQVLKVAGNPNGPSNIEALEQLRSDISSLRMRQRDILQSIPLDAGFEEQEEQRRELDEAVSLCRSLLEQPIGPSTARSSPSVVIAGFIGMLFLFLVALVLNARLSDSIFSALALTGFMAAGIVMGFWWARAGRAQGKRQAAQDPESLGEKYSIHPGSPHLIASKMSELEKRRSDIDEWVHLRNEMHHINKALQTHGLAVDFGSDLSELVLRIGELISLSRLADSWYREEENANAVSRAAELKRQSIVNELHRCFPELVISENVGSSWLSTIMSDFCEELATQVKVSDLIEAQEAHVRRIDADLAGIREQEKRCQDEVAKLFKGSGYSIEQLNDDLLDRLEKCEECSIIKSTFESACNALFGAELETAFTIAELDLLTFRARFEELQAQRSSKKTQLDDCIRQQTEIKTKRQSLFEVNPIAEVEARRQAFLAEAEEMLAGFRANALALELLKRANLRFELFHQPELMKLSSEIFARITEGRYLSIIKKDGGKSESIYVRNSRGEDVSDADLSRGAREQLYIAIRIALATRPESLDLPILMDDIMVNADIKRADGLAGELARVSRSRQILYFCAKADAVEILRATGEPLKVIELARL